MFLLMEKTVHKPLPGGSGSLGVGEYGGTRGGGGLVDEVGRGVDRGSLFDIKLKMII